MLTFFRRIRKSLIGSSQARKYILYAACEIALVVIGILIALQINNWNEERKSRQIEHQLLLGLKAEVLKNKATLEESLRQHEGYHEVSAAILPFLNSDIRSHDTATMDSLISNLRFGYTFNPRYGLLKSIISSGEIRHIRNRQLVSLLSEFEDNVVDVTEEAIETREIWRKSLSSPVGKYVPFNSHSRLINLSNSHLYESLSASSFPHDLQGFFSDRILEAQLANMTVYLLVTIEEEKILLATMDHMLTLLENELDGR
jgi:hypothetical protein